MGGEHLSTAFCFSWVTNGKGAALRLLGLLARHAPAALDSSETGCVSGGFSEVLDVANAVLRRQFDPNNRKPGNTLHAPYFIQGIFALKNSPFSSLK